MKRTFENLYLSLYINEGILFAHFRGCGLPITAAVAVELENARIGILQGEEMPMLVTAEKRVQFTFRALVYFARSERTAGIKTAAIVLEGRMVSFYARLFLRLRTKKHILIKTFPNREKALEWLYTFYT